MYRDCVIIFTKMKFIKKNKKRNFYRINTRFWNHKLKFMLILKIFGLSKTYVVFQSDMHKKKIICFSKQNQLDLNRASYILRTYPIYSRQK